MADFLVGSTAGSDSGSAYAAASTDLTVTGGGTYFLLAITAHVINAGSYDLVVAGVVVDTKVAATAGTLRFLLNVEVSSAAVTRVSVRRTDSSSARVRYAPSAVVLTPELSTGPWVELGSYGIPWIWEIDNGQPDPTPPTICVPAYELHGDNRRVVTAQIKTDAATGWAREEFLPVMRSPMIRWMEQETGFVWPGSTGVRWPTGDRDCLT